jgi:hypothetical protein
MASQFLPVSDLMTPRGRNSSASLRRNDPEVQGPKPSAFAYWRGSWVIDAQGGSDNSVFEAFFEPLRRNARGEHGLRNKRSHCYEVAGAKN